MTRINGYKIIDGLFVAGSAAAPSITFTSDPDTGFYNYSANQIGITLGGSNVTTFSGSNVGIGTTTPAQMLNLKNGHLRLDQVAAPAAPTVAVNPTAGNLNGNYYYRITFVTALGETESGASSVLVAPAAQQVDLSNIPVSSDSAVTSRKIYRTTAGGANILMKLVATIADNTTTTYTDNIADASLGVSESRVNTTGGLIYNGSVRAGIIDNATTAIGMNALRVNTGYQNNAMGVNALYSNTTGYYNSAMGVNALYSNTTGYQNNAMGMNALYSNTTGNYNNAMGVNVLYANTTGSYNSAQGYSALYNNTTGNYNSAMGVNAGRYIADGVTVNQTSTNSLYLGYGTRALADADTNEIVIGASAIGNGSNSVTLGNTSITKTILRGNVGFSLGAVTLGAAATTFAAAGNVMTITGDAGGNTVATITAGVTGQRLILIFVDDKVTITDTDDHTANTVDLSAAFTSADDTTLELVFDGTSWYEVSRSVN